VSPSKQQRQRDLARAHYERQQARRHHHNRRRERQKWISVITVGSIIAAIGLGWVVHLLSTPAGKAAADASPSATPQVLVKVGPNPALVASCRDANITVNAKPPTFAAPAGVLKPGTHATATLATNCGPIRFALDTKNAPKTSNAFAFLSGKGYYNDTACHRLTTASLYVLQCGDPTGTGTGNVGYELSDENLPKADKQGQGTYPAGSVAMAEGASGKAGAQFFIVYRATQLPANYTIFGHVTQGLSTLLKIAKAGSTPSGDGVPNQAVVISRATVATS
jgi:peptidyl-prolyl cis-trans isomerase B (cyclophilin B)